MNGNRIIVHTLIKNKDGFLVTKRSKEENVYAEYWDIPGGLAEYGELPRDAVKREVFEEVGLHINPTRVIHEDSNYDKKKDMIFIRLVYLCEITDDSYNIKLQEEEHTEYRFIKSLDDLVNEKYVSFLEDVFKKV